MKVRECFRTISAGVDLVAPEASIEEVIASVTRDPASRVVFVVDQEHHLLGIIEARGILSVLGGKYVQSTFGQTRELLATCATDIMRAPHWLSPEEDLEEGLRIAVQQDLYDIPVVEDGQVIGNLDCLEIIVNCRPAQGRKE
ncbi:MAG: CBS domain-containing protein [Candidatus Binatia bacterium]